MIPCSLVSLYFAGLGLPLAKQLYVHGYVTVDNKKMSKSLGNSVSPHDIIQKYGADAFRYYFLRHVPSYDDGEFSLEAFEAAYNNELANELATQSSAPLPWYRSTRAAWLVMYQRPGTIWVRTMRR